MSSPAWCVGDDPLDPKFIYGKMEVLPPFPSDPPKPQGDLMRWQQFQRLRFEFKERGLPTDGSYKPPGGTPSATASPSLSVKVPSSPIHRTVSTPVLESKDKPASKEMARTTSTAISRRESSGTGWTRPSSPSISLGAMAGAGRARSDSVSRAKTNVAKSITDTFDKARGHLNDAVFPKAISCYTEVAVETMSQLSFCLIQTEEYEEALTVLDFILHFKADHGKALIRKAKVYALMDDLAMADSYRVKALPLVRESDPELWEVNHMCEKSIALPPRAGVNGSFRETAIKTLPPVSPTKDISPRRTDSPITPPRGPASVPLGARAPPPAKFRTSSRGSQDIPVAGEAVPQEEAPTSPKGDGPISPKGASAPKKPAPQPPAKPLPMPRKPAESAEPVVKLTEDDDFLAIALNYHAMSNDDLPPLPSNPPNVDEDMLRWQQFQRLKSEYKERQLQPRFAIWKHGEQSGE